MTQNEPVIKSVWVTGIKWGIGIAIALLVFAFFNDGIGIEQIGNFILHFIIYTLVATGITAFWRWSGTPFKSK